MKWPWTKKKIEPRYSYDWSYDKPGWDVYDGTKRIGNGTKESHVKLWVADLNKNTRK